MGFELQALVFGLLVPGAVSLACCWAAARRPAAPARGLAGSLIFLAVAACAFAMSLISFPPREAWQWLPWLALAMTLPSLLTGHLAILEIFYAIIAIAAAWLLVPDVERLAPQRPYWLAALPALVLASTTSAVWQARTLDGPALAFYWVLISSAAPLLVFLASLGTFAHLAGMLTASAAGAFIAGLLRRGRPINAVLAPGWASLCAGLVLEARLASFSEVPLASYLLVLLSPFMIWLTALPGLRKMKPVWRTTIGTLCVLAPLAIGLALAGQVALRDVEEW
jgi:hypothetical protein